MRVGLNVLLWTAAFSEEHLPLLERIREWGFDAVEFPMFSPDCSPWAGLSGVLDELGLERTAVTIMSPAANPIAEDAAVRRAGVEHLKACIDSCAALGARTLVGPMGSPVGMLVGRGATEQEWVWGVEALRAAAGHAGEAGVALAVEAINRFENYFVTCVGDGIRLVDAVGHPACRMMFDTFHANIEEKDPVGAIGSAGRRIAHFHVSENDRGTPGAGHIPWPAVFAALKATGYDGHLTVEAFGRALPEVAAATCIWRDLFPSEEHLARTAARFIREGWAAAG